MKTRLTITLASLAVILTIPVGMVYSPKLNSLAALVGSQTTSRASSSFVLMENGETVADDDTSLLAVGDIMLSRGVAGKIKSNKDVNYPLLKLSDYLQSADITFGNLESPITIGRVIVPFEMVFRAEPGVEKSLKRAGFDIFSLANNHIPNFGSKGIVDTLSYLDGVGISHIGAGKDSAEANTPAYITHNNLTFAFLAYNDSDVVPTSYEATSSRAGTAFMRAKKMVESVRQAKLKADFVIVSMHSGTEYAKKPNSSQINFAHAVIDAGAELVIGHHPHVIQPVEVYKGKYVFYSLGNFIFDQMWSTETREGLTAKIIFNSKGVRKIEVTPVLIHDYAQPNFLDKVKAEKIFQKLKKGI